MILQSLNQLNPRHIITQSPNIPGVETRIESTQTADPEALCSNKSPTASGQQRQLKQTKPNYQQAERKIYWILERNDL